MHHLLYVLLNQVIFDLHRSIVIFCGIYSIFVTKVITVFYAFFLNLDFERNFI